MNTVIENMGYWSIIPPLLTVAIALIWKDVVIALVAGIFSGTLIVNKGNIASAAVQIIDRIASSLSDSWNIRIFLFCALLGSLVAILSRTGSAYAFGKWAAQRIKTRRGTLIFTFFFGILIFIDDYFNSLSVGTAMRPVCDRMKISRAKLAYILDSTAAPVCIIAPVSSWVVTVMSYVRKGEGFSKLGMSEFDFFLRLIPYNLYVILTLLFIIVCMLILQRDFGPMLRSEQRAVSGKGLFDEERYGKNVCDDSMKTDTKAKPADMIFPLLVLVTSAVLSFPLTTYYTELKAGKFKTLSAAYESMSLMDAFRNTDVSCALFYSIVVTLAVVILWCICRGLLKTGEISDAIIDGVRSMIPALVILVLAWTIGGVIRNAPSEGGVGLASFLSQIVKNGSFPFALLPLLVFCCSCLIAFSTGTSWGCMAIMIPVTMPLAMAAGEAAAGTQLDAVLFVMSAAIGGAIYGDHASPISDTTILSATGAGCPCLEHVATQMPYASFVAICSGLGYLAGGWSLNLGVAAAVSLVIFAAGVIFLPRLFSAK